MQARSAATTAAVVLVLALAACGEAIDDLNDLPQPAIRETPTPFATLGGDRVPQNTATPDPTEPPDHGTPTPIPTPTPTPTDMPPATDGEQQAE